MTNKQTGTIEFLPSPQTHIALTPEEMLTLHLDDADKGETLSYYLETRPAIHDVVLRLARYLSMAIPGRRDVERTLFDECLSLATKEWIYSSTHGADPARQTAYFLRGLMAPITQLQQLTVKGVVGTDTIQWDPLETPLMRWAEQLDGFPLVFDGAPDAYWTEFMAVDFRLMIATRFLCTDPDSLRMAAPYCDFIIDR